MRSLACFLLLGAASCASSSSPATPTGGGTTGACGLATYGADALCQAWIDQGCCAQERACAGDTGCKAAVTCVDACPSPRKDACINSCTASGAGTSQLSAIATCSQGLAPPALPDGGNCGWP